mgnify:CR=1 FL=1
MGNKSYKVNMLNIVKHADPEKTNIADNIGKIFGVESNIKNKVFIDALKESSKGKVSSLGGAPKGRIPWNKGLTKADPRVKANHEKATATRVKNGSYSHTPPKQFGDNNFMRSPEGRKLASERAKRRWADLKKKNPSAPNLL